MQKLRIAIFHDFFGTIGGGEKLVIALAKGLGADIITTQADKACLKKLGTEGLKIYSLGNPINFPVLKQVSASLKFRAANFPNYDVYIFSGNWAIFASKKHKPNVFYCHTPVRMFYQDYDYFKGICPLIARPFFILWVKLHKLWMERYLRHLGSIVANSRECQARIKKYYRRESTVVNPPIKKYSFREYGNFWLSVNRLYPHKRVDLQLDAFRRMPNERLVIVGGTTEGDNSQEYEQTLKKACPANVTFRGAIPEGELEQLYGSCKGFVTTSLNEDFGMTVLEAMSAGKPVVAVKEGGYTETLTDRKTGLLVTPRCDELVAAMKEVSRNPAAFKRFCKSRAAEYSEALFLGRMRHVIDEEFRKIKDS